MNKTNGIKCGLCQIEFEAKRTDAKFCSPRCRKEASRVINDDGIKFAEPEVFEFHTSNFRSDIGWNEATPRKASRWYDVPLSAQPIIKDGWPELPEWMDGRVYFLWWKNNFKLSDDTPVIVNPNKSYDKLEYKTGGAGSRHWGA